MSPEAIVHTIFLDYLKPITYYSTLAKVFGPHSFLFIMYIINNMVASQQTSQPILPKVSQLNDDEQIFYIVLSFLVIPFTVISTAFVSTVSSDTFLLIGSSIYAGSMDEQKLLSYKTTPFFVLLANLTVIIESWLIIFEPFPIWGVLSNLRISNIFTVGAVYAAWILHLISVVSYSLYYSDYYLQYV